MNNFVQALLPTAHAQNLIPCPDGSMADPSIGCVSVPATAVDSKSGIAETLLSAAGLASWVIVALATAALIMGGIQYATAMGSEEKIEKAKRSMKWGAIGLVLGLSARILVQMVLSNLV